ncbi:unnamed protein product [Malus baccata var. baccata]
MAKLAIVDFSNEDCFKPGTSSWLSIREDICHALDKLGCFVAILPDKISLELRSTFFDTLAELFDFPTEKKVKSFYEKPYPTGYIKVGNAALMKAWGLLVLQTRNKLKYSNIIFGPNGHNVFRETADLYTKVMEELHHAVTRMAFENYGVEEYLDDHLESTTHMCRFNKYSEPEKTGTNLGLPGHTDSNFSTILYQNHVKGLEIYSKDDEDCQFYPNNFLAGMFAWFCLTQVWSNDKIRACKHRVILSENVVRHSIGLFSFRVGETHTPKEFIDEDHPLQYKPLNNWEYTQYVKKNASSLGPDYTVKAYCGV